MSKLTKRELRELSDWAESDGPVDSGVTLTADEADRMSEQMLRMVGRPLTWASAGDRCGQ